MGYAYAPIPRVGYARALHLPNATRVASIGAAILRDGAQLARACVREIQRAATRIDNGGSLEIPYRMVWAT